MEFDKPQKLHLEGENSESININIKDTIIQYLRHWKWFALSLVLSIIFAFYKLNFERPKYRATTTIKIKDEDNEGNSTLSVFQDLGVVSGSNDKIEDEVEILKSKGIVAEVIKSLGLNVRYYTNKNYLSNFLDDKLGLNTEYYETENYADPPLKINFLMSDSTAYRINYSFIITVNSLNSFSVTDIDKTFLQKHDFGEKINIGFGDIIIVPATDLKERNLIGSNILIQINSVPRLARALSRSISIEPKSERSSILDVSIVDGVRRRSRDFLNELIKKYNERSIFLKEELSKSTSDFVNQRLEIISNELSDVDIRTETLKTRYAGTDTGLNMQSGQDLENQIVGANTKLQLIESLKSYVSEKDPNEPIPQNLGIEDNNVQSASAQYNNLIIEKQRLLKNSTEKNPIIVNINDQLAALENNIKRGLDNLSSTQQISIDALNKQDAIINSRLYSAPKQERQIRNVQRQQGIKEALYLYLLQKREETAITLGVVDPNAMVIESAESVGSAISPKKKVFYLVHIFLGLVIPFVIIFLRDFLNTTIKSREEVEKILNIPILGDIPKLESKKRFLINKEDHSSTAEAFRILRTNLNFLLTNSNAKGKTIFVTSTIAHEGKSFVASNLAASLGYAGKKTLILGMDVRAPTIKSYLGIRGSLGVTNYIIDNDLSLKDIVVSVPKVENLDLVSSGDIAPNPAELLMSTRVKELFDEVKERYDYIIVDTAASSIITDTTIIKNYADAFIYVIRVNFLDKRLLSYVKSLYKEKRFPNLALLVNGIDSKKGYGYGYGYGASFEKSKKKAWWKFS